MGWRQACLGALLSVLWLFGFLATQSPYLHDALHGDVHGSESCSDFVEASSCESNEVSGDEENHSCVVTLLDLGVEQEYGFEVTLLYRGVWTALSECRESIVTQGVQRGFRARAPPVIS